MMGELALIAKQILLFSVDCDTHKFFRLLIRTLSKKHF